MTSRVPAAKRGVRAWLTDMDGVLVHEGEPIPGAADFIDRLRESGRPFLVLTNNSIYTPRDLQARLHRSGHRRAGGRDLDLARWPPPSSSTTSGPAARRTSSARRA